MSRNEGQHYHVAQVMRQRGDERRQAMIAAALELVGERGPNAVTLGDVGQRVGDEFDANGEPRRNDGRAQPS